MAIVEGMDLCTSEANSQCVNTEGSFDCICVPGYIVIDGNCERELQNDITGLLLLCHVYNTVYSVYLC